MLESKAISKILIDKNDCLKQAKKLAVFVINRKKLKHISNFYDSLEKNNLTQTKLVYGSTKRLYLIFYGTEESIVIKLSNLKAPNIKHIPPPEKVLVKMVSSRLNKLHDSIMNNNMYPFYGSVQLPELKFTDLFDNFSRYGTNFGWDTEKIVRNLRRVLSRKDVEFTPEIMQKAWDIHSVNVVMKV